MFCKGDQVKWVKKQMVGTFRFRFWYAGTELFYCDCIDPQLLESGVTNFIADAEQCIGYLGPQTKERPKLEIPKIDFKPTEGVSFKVRG